MWKMSNTTPYQFQVTYGAQRPRTMGECNSGFDRGRSCRESWQISRTSRYGQRREHRASAHYLGLCDGNGDGEGSCTVEAGELHRLLNNRKESLSATYKKNAKANDRAYDMNQQTIQALNTFAEEYGTFEATMKKVTLGTRGRRRIVCSGLRGGAQKEPERLQDELDCSCEDLATASREFSNRATQEAASAKLSSAFREVCHRRAANEAICVEARRAWQKTCDLKRKASEAHENLLSHKEKTRRISNEHASADGLVNDSLGTLGQAVRAAVQATRSLTCGVPDRESIEIKYLWEATELIEKWQHELKDGQPVSRPPSEHSEVILAALCFVVDPWINACASCLVCSSRLTFFSKCEFWMILFRAERSSRPACQNLRTDFQNWIARSSIPLVNQASPFLRCKTLPPVENRNK